MIDLISTTNTQTFMLERSDAYRSHAEALAWLREQMRVHALGIYGADAILTESIDHWQALADGARSVAIAHDRQPSAPGATQGEGR